MYGPNDVPYEDTLEAADALYVAMPAGREQVERGSELDMRDAAITALVEMCQTLDEAGEFICRMVRKEARPFKYPFELQP